MESMKIQLNFVSWIRWLIQKLILIIVQLSRFINRRKIVSNPGKILLVKTHAIGDVLLTTPSIVALRHLFPEAQIYALVGNWSRPVLEYNPHLTGLISFDDSILFHYKILAIFKLIRRIKKEKFDWAFIFQPSTMVHLLIMFSGIPYRIGFDNQGSGKTLNKAVAWDIRDHTYIAEKFLELIQVVGSRETRVKLEFFLSPQDIEFSKNFYREHKRVLEQSGAIIGLCPGGGVNPRDRVMAKLWPIDRYVSLLEHLSKQTEACFIVFGLAEDQIYLKRLIRNCQPFADRIIDACMKTTLHQLGALFMKCDLIITNDSAPLHVAVALGVPTVSIFGPTNHRVLLPAHTRHQAIQSTLNCSPCYHNSPFPGCIHVRCMEDISVQTVVERTLSHLRKTS
ncbi:lipopolysaccharide heptosyltransferase II [bacterium]|nr:lipopolysaccharide heptosyltransferase II [bacterium]